MGSHAVRRRSTKRSQKISRPLSVRTRGIRPLGTKTTEVLISLALESKEAVHRLVDAAVRAGANEPRPVEDYGFMIQRGFEDLDGHNWGVLFMDPAHVQSQT